MPKVNSIKSAQGDAPGNVTVWIAPNKSSLYPSMNTRIGWQTRPLALRIWPIASTVPLTSRRKTYSSSCSCLGTSTKSSGSSGFPWRSRCSARGLTFTCAQSGRARVMGKTKLRSPRLVRLVISSRVRPSFKSKGPERTLDRRTNAHHTFAPHRVARPDVCTFGTLDVQQHSAAEGNTSSPLQTLLTWILCIVMHAATTVTPPRLSSYSLRPSTLPLRPWVELFNLPELPV